MWAVCSNWPNKRTSSPFLCPLSSLASPFHLLSIFSFLFLCFLFFRSRPLFFCALLTHLFSRSKNFSPPIENIGNPPSWTLRMRTRTHKHQAKRATTTVGYFSQICGLDLMRSAGIYTGRCSCLVHPVRSPCNSQVTARRSELLFSCSSAPPPAGTMEVQQARAVLFRRAPIARSWHRYHLVTCHWLWEPIQGKCGDLGQ